MLNKKLSKTSIQKNPLSSSLETDIILHETFKAPKNAKINTIYSSQDTEKKNIIWVNSGLKNHWYLVDSLKKYLSNCLKDKKSNLLELHTQTPFNIDSLKALDISFIIAETTRFNIKNSNENINKTIALELNYLCSLLNDYPDIFDDALCVMIEECKHNTTPHSFLKCATFLNAPLAIYKLKQLNHEESPMFEEKTFYETTVYSCLHMACQNGHNLLAKSLLFNNYLTDSHDFENNFFDKSIYTKTPLYTACSNNHLAIVKLLLKFEHKNDYGFSKFNYNTGITEKISALAVACLNSNLEIIKLLLEDGTNKHLGQCVINKKNQYMVKFSSLHKPLINHDRPVIELLLKNGCKNEYCEEIYVEKDQVVKKLSPLIIACSEGDLSMVKFLFKHGLNKNIGLHGFNLQGQKTQHISPLFMACQNGYTKIVSFLLENNFKIENDYKLFNNNLTLIESSSSLYVACQNGYEDIANLLLIKHANVNESYKCFDSFSTVIKEITPLYVACENRHAKVVNCLLRYNCDTAKGIYKYNWSIPFIYSDEFTECPLGIAKENNLTSITKSLIDHDAPMVINFQQSLNQFKALLIGSLVLFGLNRLKSFLFSRDTTNLSSELSLSSEL